MTKNIVTSLLAISNQMISQYFRSYFKVIQGEFINYYQVPANAQVLYLDTNILKIFPCVWKQKDFS